MRVTRRGWGPPFVDGSDGQPVSTYFLTANRNKVSITLDLKNNDDMEQLRRLLAKADVLIENFRPGVMARLGLTNQRMGAESAAGGTRDQRIRTRRTRKRASRLDQIAQGEAGLMSVTGSRRDDPQRVGVPIADLLAAGYGAYGVLAALHERSRTGRGQIVRTSLLAAVVASHGYQGQPGRSQVSEVRHGATTTSIAPYGLFRCGEGVIQIACGNDAQWHKLSNEFGLDVDAGPGDQPATSPHGAGCHQDPRGCFLGAYRG